MLGTGHQERNRGRDLNSTPPLLKKKDKPDVRWQVIKLTS